MTRSEPAGGHRLFFALWPDDGVRGALARAADGVRPFESGRRVPDAKLHLTLHFLGGWPAPRDDIVDAATAAAATVEVGVFHLVVDHAGGFHGARVGWLAPSGSSGLDALWSGLGRALDDAGVHRRAQRRFSPHVTVRRDIRERLRDVPIDPVSWPVDAFVLVHSHDGRYDVLSRWPLAS